MELLNEFYKDKTYCESIQPSSYQQSLDNKQVHTKSKSYHTIISLFIDNFDPTCSILPEKEKQVYMQKLAVEIASEIDEKPDICFDKMNYSKLMKKSTIQQGFQVDNSVSSLIYLGDYYKVSPIIHLLEKKKSIQVSEKKRDELHIGYIRGKFSLLETPPTFSLDVFSELDIAFVMDVKDRAVYNKYLNPISKYKVGELQDKATEIKLSIHDLGKKKTKKQLYDEINMYYLNNPN